MKFTWKGYWEPTPKKIRKIADAILATATLISTYSFFNDNKGFALSVMIISSLAKFLSNFFADDNEIS